VQSTEGTTALGSIELLTVNRQRDANSAGVAWGAVIGGAFVVAATGLIMLALGAGFGLSVMSPWNAGETGSDAGTAAIVWLVITELIASSIGGYLTGRLRTRWLTLHNDEVHFRDTANGFLAWAVALVMTMALLTTAASSMVGKTPASDQSSLGRRGASDVRALEVPAYFVDRLFRSDHPASGNDDAIRSEAGRILAYGLHRDLSPADTAYLAKLVASKTELSAADANNRVSDTVAALRQSADDARKSTAHFLLWTFLALLFGAFCASFAATIGGRQRDHAQFS
jgi:hypothetical protein